MISGKIPMFDFDPNILDPEKPCPFPIYIHLAKSQRYVPIRLEEDPLSKEKLELYIKRGIKQLWVPESYRPAFGTFFKKPDIEVVPSKPDEEGIFEETEIVAEVLMDQDLSQDAKAEILASLGQDLLRSFNQISNRGEDGQREAIKRGRQIADEILAIAAQTSTSTTKY